MHTRTNCLCAATLFTLILNSNILAAETSRALVLEPTCAARDDTDKPVMMRADLAVTSVTLYRSRAAVTRSASPELAQGLYELRVGPLPEAVDLDSVQARLGGTAKLLDVKTETVTLPAPSSDNPRVREALVLVDAAQALVTDIARRNANNVAAQKTLDSIAAKVASDASLTIGVALDPEKLRAQLSFIDAERERLTASAQAIATEAKDAAGRLRAANDALAAAGGAPPTERFALVSIVVPDAGPVPLSVTYLVANASWQPSYTVRGDPESASLVLEFDAIVQQATGEDWNDVSLLLSTAQPTRSANPRQIDPIYVAIYEPMPVSESAYSDGAVSAPAAPAMMADARMRSRSDAGGSGGEAAKRSRLSALGADAQVGGTGPAVEYQLPRTFSAASDANAERKTRVANITAAPKYTLVTRPLVDADVYLRARFLNESGFLLLLGNARMYLGADSIGQTVLTETPVGGEVELWFGKESRVTVKRELVAKKDSESGVFSKSKSIDRDYRIVLANTIARAVDVEVWDRAPVSQSDEAKVAITDVTPALSTDEKYVKDSKPQGLLKWTLALPARAASKDAKPVVISWKTRLSWPEGKMLSGDVD